jgi:DNA repair helicase Rad3
VHTYLWLLHTWIPLSIPIPTRWRERYQQDFLSCFPISLTWTFFALQFAGTDTWLANPALPDDILRESVPGNIRRAEHFVSFLKRLVQYLKGRLQTEQVESEGPVSFLNSLQSQAGIDQKTLKFCYDRLHSLLLTLEVTDTDEFMHIQCVCDFATLVGTYTRGFSIIIEPYDERMPNVPDPVLQLSCLDASLAIKPVFERFQSVVITSGTLSPIDLYPRLLNFNPVISRSFEMSLTRDCLCPMILTRGSDQLPVSTKFDMRSDPGVVRNYGRLLLEMVGAVPDGVVCFFVSYSYMDGIVNSWNEMGILQEVMQHKLVFIETQDVVETTLALDNYRRACDCGRGAVFFSVARGKVAEGIDFDRHYGRLVIMFGVPFQFTLSRYSTSFHLFFCDALISVICHFIFEKVVVCCTINCSNHYNTKWHMTFLIWLACWCIKAVNFFCWSKSLSALSSSLSLCRYSPDPLYCVVFSWQDLASTAGVFKRHIPNQ